jgi:hypothetical protein
MPGSTYNTSGTGVRVTVGDDNGIVVSVGEGSRVGVSVVDGSEVGPAGMQAVNNIRAISIRNKWRLISTPFSFEYP